MNLRQWIAAIWARLWKKPEPEPEPAIAAKTDSPPQQRARFRKRLLDDLDGYFRAVRHMQRTDPSSYALYSKIGGHISTELPDSILINQLSPWWNVTRPSFGCVAFMLDDEARAEKDVIYPRFLYFRKYKKDLAPPEVQRIIGAGDVYVITVFWYDKDGNEEWSAPYEFPVFIGIDGLFSILKTKTIVHHSRRIKRGRDHGDYFHIPQTTWKYDDYARRWAREHKRPVEEHLRGVFCIAAHEYEWAIMQSMVRIAATRGNITAVFGIDLRRSAYFFKDREFVPTSSGKRQRVFHIVRAHERLRGNEHRPIRLHFRGARDFEWNGYQIHISVPGLHHADPSEFASSAADSEMIPADEAGWIDVEQVAERIAEHTKTTVRELRDVRRRT